MKFRFAFFLVFALVIICLGWIGISPAFAAEPPISISNATAYDSTGHRITASTSYKYTRAPVCPVAYIITSNGQRIHYKSLIRRYTSNRAAGRAKVTLIGLSALGTTGSLSVSYKISKHTSKKAPASSNVFNMAEASVSPILARTYTGSPIRPAVFVRLNGRILPSSAYSVSYNNNISAGTATVNIVGKGRFIGTKKATFEIKSTSSVSDSSSIANASVSVANQTYTGQPLTPEPVVRIGSKILEAGKDYLMSYTSNTNAGQAMVTIVAQGDYTGIQVGHFTILPAQLSTASVDAIPEQTYTGKAITPSLAVSSGSRTLLNGTDYSAVYSSNISAGTAMVTLSGTGNYAGTKTVNFIIAKAPNPLLVSVFSPRIIYNPTNRMTVSASEAYSVRGAQGNVTYSKISGNPNISVAGNGSITVAPGTPCGTYSLNVAVNASGNSNYLPKTMNVTVPLIISDVQPEQISTATITGLSSKSYTGAALTPSPIVRLGTKNLVKDEDYTVSYKNNINVGTASVTITGKGSYVGTKTATFTIAPAAISSASFSSIASQTYTGSPIKPVFTVKLGNRTLSSSSDYMTTYSANTSAGTAKITITGKGNYTGTKTADFTIAPASISSATFSSIASQTYTGAALTPLPTVNMNGKTLARNADYTISYVNNTNPGTATLKITGCGNYTGSTSTNFTINKANVSQATISAIASQIYTGAALTPAPTVSMNGKTLTRNTDYTLSYASNINVGTGKVTVTGSGNYTGTKSISFTIDRASVSTATIPSIGVQNYTGKAITPTPSVSVGGRVLKKDTDYTLAYTSNTAAGESTAKVIVTGKGNYKGTKTLSFSIRYVISYHLNSGTNNSANPTHYKKGNAAITLKNPSRVAYTFEGWYSESTFKTKVTTIPANSTGNKNLYAKWTPTSYSYVSHDTARSENITTMTNRYKGHTKGGIAIVGTSYMALWNAETTFDNIGFDAGKVYNFAIGGENPSTLFSANSYLDMIAEKEPHVVVINGANCLWTDPSNAAVNDDKVKLTYNAQVALVSGLRTRLKGKGITPQFVLTSSLKTPDRYKRSGVSYTADSGPSTCTLWNRVDSLNSKLKSFASNNADVTYFNLESYFYKIVSGKVRYYLTSNERSSNQPTGRAVKLLTNNQTNVFLKNDLHHPSPKAYSEIFPEVAKTAKNLFK